jgi:antirestriction protein ArdC
VRKGEKACPVVLYKPFEREETNPDTGENEMVETYVARLFGAFNADQVDGWEIPSLPATGIAESIQSVETFVSKTGANITHQGTQAFYSPLSDTITMPEQACFIDTLHSSATENFYSTLFHELTHWTGHDNRLNRNLISVSVMKAVPWKNWWLNLGPPSYAFNKGYPPPLEKIMLPIWPVGLMS